MADNAMVIVCEVCHPKPEEWYWGSGVFCIAKYFWSTYSFSLEKDQLGKWIREHAHGICELAAMPVHFSLQFESRTTWAERGTGEPLPGRETWGEQETGGKPKKDG